MECVVASGDDGARVDFDIFVTRYRIHAPGSCYMVFLLLRINAVAMTMFEGETTWTLQGSITSYLSRLTSTCLA